MWLTDEIISARSVARGALMAMATQARALTGLLRRISGSVGRTAAKERRGEMLLWRKEMLAAELEAMHPNDPRRGKMEAKLRSLTHDILRRGRNGQG